MFAIFVKRNQHHLKLLTVRNKFKLLHGSASHMKSKSPPAKCPPDHEEEDDEEEEYEDKPQNTVCPKDPCKAQPSEGQCLPPPPKPPKAVGQSHFLGAIGPKQIAVVVSFIPGLLRYGVVALLCLTYMSEFKTVLQYLPFYNGKYYEEEDVKQSKPKEGEGQAETGKQGQVGAAKDC